MYKLEQRNYTYTKNYKISFSISKYQSIKVIFLLTIALFLTTILIQLIVTSLYSTQSDKLVALENKRDRLVVENLKLKKEIAYSTKLEKIQKEAEENGFVPIDRNKVKSLKVEK